MSQTPPQQPGWSTDGPPPAYPQPYGQPGYAPPGAPAAGARPGGVTAAAVILIILGVLAAIFAIFMIVAAGALTGGVSVETEGGILDLGGAFAGAIWALALVALAFGVLEIIAGIKTLGLKPGSGRILGIILASLGTLFWLIGLIGSFSGSERLDPETFEVVSGGPQVGGIVMALIFLGAYLTVLVLLAKNGRAFRSA